MAAVVLWLVACTGRTGSPHERAIVPPREFIDVDDVWPSATTLPRFGNDTQWGVVPLHATDPAEATWVLHPPAAFVADMVGHERFERCWRDVVTGVAPNCQIHSECVDIDVWPTGNVVMLIQRSCTVDLLAKELVVISIVEDEVITIRPDGTEHRRPAHP